MWCCVNLEEKERNRNDKLGEYFLNLSNTTIGTTVLGMLVSSIMDIDADKHLMVILIICIGLIASIALASVGNNFLKK